MTSSGTTDTSSDGTSTTSTTGPTGDPDYPSPDPVAGDGTCPPTTLGPITFDGDAWVCLPPCDADDTCPPPSSGSAEAACASNPQSTGDPCETSDDCTVEGEMCGNIGNDQKGCLLPPSHCVLRCDPELACPDDMVCATVGICAYPP
jgi:hypothetical protein